MRYFSSSSTLESQQDEIQEGVIDAVLNPGKMWRVKAEGGVYWRAITLTNANFSLDELVNIIGRRNNQLIIEPK